MTTATTGYQHIELGQNGAPVVGSTGMKVVALVLEHLAYGWSPEELHFQHPQLSLGEIHSAFAYYWDHREELDRDLERRLERVRTIREQTGAAGLGIRLRQRRLL